MVTLNKADAKKWKEEQLEDPKTVNVRVLWSITIGLVVFPFLIMLLGLTNINFFQKLMIKIIENPKLVMLCAFAFGFIAMIHHFRAFKSVQPAETHTRTYEGVCLDPDKDSCKEIYIGSG